MFCETPAWGKYLSAVLGVNVIPPKAGPYCTTPKEKETRTDRADRIEFRSP
jgi:hypothetical protein